MNEQERYPLWWAVLAGALGFVTAFRPLADIDVHWHLAMGRAYLEQGLWLDHDPISYLPLIRDVDMGAWGGQVLFAWADSLFGITGVILVVALVAAACHVAVLDLTWRRHKDRATSLLSVAVFAAASVHRWRGRPDILSTLFFILMIAVLTRKNEKRSVAIYGLLALVWINFHPGAIIMPLFAAVAALGGRARLHLKQAAWACAAILVTPRGPFALAELVYHTVTTGSLVPEWRPLWQQPFEHFKLEWLLLLAVAGVLLTARPWRKKMGLPVLSFLWALRSFRLSYMMFVPVLFAGSTKDRPHRRKAFFIMALIFTLMLPLANRWRMASRSRDLGASPWTGIHEPAYPVGAAKFINFRELKGRLFHPVNWGGFLGSTLAPRNRSAHDGRISLWGHDYAAELLKFDTPEGRERLREQLNFEIVVADPAFFSGFELVQHGGRWRPVYADTVAAVFVDTQGENWEFNSGRL